MAPPDGPSPTFDPGLAGGPARPVDGIDNGFVAGYRVRFDEAGPDGAMRTAALLRYAQDVAWRHSEDRGFDRSWYTDRGRWWVVRAVSLEVVAAVPMGHVLRLATAVSGHRRIWALRLAEARLADGSIAARIRTDWVILDERGRLVRIPDDFGLAFPNPEVLGETLRVSLPEAPAGAGRHPIGVRQADLDPMGHVNNAAYLDWAEEAVSAAGGQDDIAAMPRRWTLEYVASAGPGDALTAISWRDGSGWWHRLTRDPDGTELIRARLDVPEGPAS